MNDMHEARWLLRNAGLKSSLPRLKILTAILRLAPPGAWVGDTELQAELLRAGSPLPQLSLSQVLKRMIAGGVLVNAYPARHALAPGLAHGVLEARASAGLADTMAPPPKSLELQQKRPLDSKLARRIGPFTGGPRRLRAAWLTTRLHAGSEQ